MQVFRVVALAALLIVAPTIRASGAIPSSHQTAVRTQWHVGSTWAVSVFAADHRLIGSMVVRLTPAKATSCINGDWKRLDVLKRQFDGTTLLATKPLAYSSEGNQIAMGVTDICDGYIFLHGILTNEGISGDYGTLGLDGFHKLGYFVAKIVNN